MIEFKTIKEFPNYLIGNNGEVYSRCSLKARRPTSNGSGKGYLYVDLYKNNIRKKCYVHRLVAEHFIPNPNNKTYINHIDGNTMNNNVENLEWCTPLENVEHAAKVLKVMSGYQKHNEKKKRKIFAFDYYTDKIIGEYDSVRECAKSLGLNAPNITQNARDKFTRQLKGMYFRYEENIYDEKPKTRHIANNISTDEIIQLRVKGYTYKEIATHIGSTESLVYHRLKKSKMIKTN